MDDRIKQIIGSSRNKVSIDTDVSTNISLDNTTRLIKTNANQINSVIGVDDQFDLERHESSLYRMLGRVNIVTANELTYGDDTNRSTEDIDWNPLFNEFINASNQFVKTPNNWLMQICYPSSKLENFKVWGTNRPISLGMKVGSLETSNPSNNRGLLVVKTIQKHKLSEGDYIHINYVGGDIDYQGMHKVYEVGYNGAETQTSVTLETTFQAGTNQTYTDMFIKRVVGSSDEDGIYLEPDTMVSFTNSDITGGTNNSDYITIQTTTTHGLGTNDYVEIRKLGISSLKGLHRVQHVIDDYGYTVRYSNTIPATNGYTYRRMDGTPSDYYVRDFEVLTGVDYEIYRAAYSSLMYPETSSPDLGVANNTWIYHFNKDLNTGDLISHRGGKVNELKICMLKRAGQNPYDWSNVTSHWDFDYELANTQQSENGLAGTSHLLEEVSVRSTTATGVGSIEKNSRRTISADGSKYIGDIVEYNRKEVKEKILTEVIFRFGVATGVINNNNRPDNTAVLFDGTETVTSSTNGPLQDLEGYYYKPFKTVEIKKFSNLIENADPEDNIVGAPADLELYSDGSMSWRDLLTDGFIEEGNNGVDWPFLNGRHYIYVNNQVYIRRQRPYETIDQSDIISIDPNDNC